MFSRYRCLSFMHKDKALELERRRWWLHGHANTLTITELFEIK